MVVLTSSNTAMKTADLQATLVYSSMDAKYKFQKWLTDGNTRKYSPETILSCIDKISDYAINKKIIKCSLWEYKHPNAFSPVYKKLIEAKLLRITERKTYKVFIIAGQLYLRFLKETPSTNKELVVNSKKADATAKTERDIHEDITTVLSKRFSNGYRLNSPIELSRFRSFAKDDLAKELTLSDEELKDHIVDCGTTFEGKVYVISLDAKEKIQKLVDEYFSEGAKAIFFSEFYAKNESWLFDSNIISEDMLIDILRNLFPQMSFTQRYFGYTKDSVFFVLKDEILRVWGDDILLTYDQLAQRLIYIPVERIKYALGQNGNFIWSSIETFSHISRIEITDEEHETIKTIAVQGCNAYGYVSITDLPLDDIAERNYELSVTAIHNAVYRICLSDKFDKKGKIITRKGDVFDAFAIMKEYCMNLYKCTLSDLLDYERELTGEVHRWIPMAAGNDILVRIDKDNYVADRYVHFDSDLIDVVIELLLKGDYLPLKSFTTFGAFPDCGQTWNLFLLESYCRRFSQKFRFDTPSVNSRNAGTIICKSCEMDYTKIMIDAVANADVPLKTVDISLFLYDSGYTGRSTTAKVTEIINKARTLREGRN